MNKYKTFKLSNGLEVINITRNPLTFLSNDGTETIVPPSGVVIDFNLKNFISSAPEEVDIPEGVEFQEPAFMGTIEGYEILDKLPENVIIIGTLIMAQAYPERICSTIAYPGYEIAPIEQRKVREDKFIRYSYL